MIRKAKESNASVDLALLEYRNTPISGMPSTGVTYYSGLQLALVKTEDVRLNAEAIRHKN